MNNRTKIIIVAFLVLIGGIALDDKYSQQYFDVAKNLDIFATLYREVNTYYVDEVDATEFIRTGIDAMLNSLDPYTNFISEDQIEDFRTLTTGEYGGIGAVIGQRDGEILVIMPYEGDPADKAGLKAGDKILKVNKIEVKGKTTGEVSKLLKGQSKSTLLLEISRINREESFEVEIMRKNIKIANVPYWGLIDDEIGYIRLTDFSIGSYSEVRKGIEDLQKQGVKKLIFDLRENPGGSLDEAIKICSIFLPTGTPVVETKGRYEQYNKSYNTLIPPLDTANMPLVILTSESSASASEIVAGVIQDYDRGILVGQQTFGKGLVQMTRPLVYNSQLKVTTSRYYIPSGRCIQAIDYSQRNPHGKAVKVPDSLLAEFETANGRPVFDGRGIKPDLKVELDDFAPITFSLLRKNHIFNYSTEYFYKHQEIASPREFSLSEEEYGDFISWLEDKDYEYTTQVEKTLTKLEELSKEEKNHEVIEIELESLREKLFHNKKADLENFKDEIKTVLEEEIIGRYFYQRGVVESSFKTDSDIQSAIKILRDKDEYKITLTARIN
jgi:carboxyl-terminal processing protease